MMTASPEKPGPWGPLALSALLHAGLALAGAAVLAALPPAAAPAPRRDAWAGDTFEIDGLVRGGDGARRAPRARAAPAPPGPPAAAPKTPPVIATRAPRARAPAGAPPPNQDPGRSTARSHAARSHAAASHAAASHAAPGVSPRPPSVAAPDLARAMADAADGKQVAGGGRFGAAGVLPGVRDLATAFTRALPRAASGDPLWSKLPLGPAGDFHVVIRIDDQRRIESAKPDEKTLAPVLRHLLDRTILMLRAGQFALDRSDVTSGSEKLHVQVAISMRAPSGQIDVNPLDTVELGFRPPARDRPGVGYFTLASGRHVEAKVTMERGPRAGPALFEQ